MRKEVKKNMCCRQLPLISPLQASSAKSLCLVFATILIHTGLKGHRKSRFILSHSMPFLHCNLLNFAFAGWLNPVTGPQVQNQVGQQSQYIDQNLLQQLAGMGFSHNRASRACASTQNTGQAQLLLPQ